MKCQCYPGAVKVKDDLFQLLKIYFDKHFHSLDMDSGKLSIKLLRLSLFASFCSKDISASPERRFRP